MKLKKTSNEAVRTEEHGREFAVVAYEVKALAQKIQGFAFDIQKMVKAIKAGTK